MPTWRSDNTAVATIDASGRLTAIANGEVTIIGEYQGSTDTKKIRVVNDYGATWYGNYVVTRCQATGQFDQGWCGPDAFGPGQTFPIGLEFQQDRDRVTGTLWLGSLNGPFTGTVASGGNLTGESKIAFTSEEGVLDVLVSPFSILREGDRITEGTFAQVITTPAIGGNCTFEARIMGLDMLSSGRTGAQRAPSVPRTWRELPRLMRQM
jgi:hypothetical protein